MKRDYSRKPTCSDPVLGELLPNYEAGSLDPQKVVQFEEHLLYCDYCFCELESGLELRQILAQHREGLQQHYAETGMDFKAELAKIGAARAPSERKSIRTILADLLERTTVSRTQWFVYPGIAVALLVTIVLFKSYRPPPTAPRIVDSQTNNLEQPSTPIVVVDSIAEESSRDSSNSTEHSRGPSGMKQKDSIERLLPKQAIPYAMLAVRGEESRDSLLSAEFQECMLPYQKGNFARSASLLSQFVATHPSDPQAQLYLGSALYMTRDFEGAIVALSAVERLGGEQIDPKVPYYRAAALIALQRTAEAKSILVKLRTSPNRIIAQQSRMLLSELESR